MPSQTIYEAFQDKKGFMWFATSSGVSRYDGYSFFNYTLEDGLPDSEIFGFYQDKHDRIWLRSMNGKIAYIFNNRVFNSNNNPSLRLLDKSSPISKISETRDGAILIAYFREGIFKYSDSNEITELLSGNPKKPGVYLSIYEMSDGMHLSISMLPDSGWSMIKFNSESRSVVGPLASSISRSELVNNKCYISRSGQFKVADENTARSSWIEVGSLIRNICKGDNNSIWICTAKGAMNFKENSKLPSKHYLKNYDISSVVVDNENTIWITTLADGVFQIKNESIKRYSSANGLVSSKVYSIAKNKDRSVYIGHDSFTLSKMNTKREITTQQIFDRDIDYLNLSKPVVYSIEVNNSEMMIVSQDGLVYRNNNRSGFYTALKGRGICQYKDDTYLVAGRLNGLRSFSKKLVKDNSVIPSSSKSGFYREMFEQVNMKQLYPATSSVNCLYKQGEDRIWIGTDDGLLQYFDGKFVKVDDQMPLLKDRIMDIKGDSKGNIFIATSNKGVFILNNNNGLLQLSKRDGLSSNQCTKLFLDESILWVGTTSGLNQIQLDENYQILGINVLNDVQGLSSNYINTIFVDDEAAWVGTANGLSILDKKFSTYEPKVPLLYITDILVNNHPMDTTLRNELDYQENNIVIKYVALSYKFDDINYKYRLLQEDDFVYDDVNPWKETGNTTVDLPLLPPGRYTFTVMAQSTKNGSWSAPVSCHLHIKAPFWKTNWFLVLSSIIATFFALLIWGYGQRIVEKRKIIKRKLQLSELNALHSQMNYHFISNAFNSLQGLFLTEKNVDQYIGKFSRLMRMTLEHSDRHLINLSEELEYLKLYCDIERLRVGNRFLFLVENNSNLELDRLNIPALTLQPLIENAIWHGVIPKDGDDGLIIFKILSHDVNSFRVIIEDNGIGINSSLLAKSTQKRKSFGTKLIMDRFQVITQQSNINFNLMIEDRSVIESISGTRVSITFPYSYE